MRPTAGASSLPPTPPGTPPGAPATLPAGGPGKVAAAPGLERVLVELTRALRREGDAFLEATTLPAAAAAHFFQATLPQAPTAARDEAYDRLLRATAEHRHNLMYAAAIDAYLRAHAGARLTGYERALASAPDATEAAWLGRQLRRLAQLELPAPLAERQRRAEAAAQRCSAELRTRAAVAPRTPEGRERALQLGQLLQLSPLTRVHHALRPTSAQPGAGRYRQVYGEGAVPVRGIVAPSELQRGRLSRIEPLLLEDGREVVVRAAQVQTDGKFAPERMSAASYARQCEAVRIAGSTMAPLASFYDAGGELHEVVARYDGDLIDLLQVHGDVLTHLGVALGVADAVLDALVPLHAHADGWAHNDVKPDNVLWRRDGSFVLTDFGDARPAGGPFAAGGTAAESDDASFSTVGFVAPELLQGHASRVADLFSLGVTLCKLLAPRELSDVPLALAVPPSHFADEDTREVALAWLEDAVDGYHAYQAGRRGEGPAGADARHYDALRAALTEACGAKLAALVVDRLLHPDPDARGSAAEHRAALQQAYPAGHPARAAARELLREAAAVCPYTLRMDATFADMRRYRDGLLRTVPSPGPPPLPARLESP